MRLCGFLLALALAVPLVSASSPARADTEDPRDEAKRLFTAGSSELLVKHYAEALDDLRASYKLVPSPNSGLLIARCLRELNRRVEAVEMYGVVAADARRRAAEGDAKYGQTADVAANEGAALRATLGLVRVRVAHAAPGSTIEVDGVARPATEGDVVVLHVPGDVTVRFKPRTGAEQSQRGTLVAGGDVKMEFTAAAEPAAQAGTSAPRAAPKPSSDEPPSWTVPASIAAGTVAVIGAGVFAGFALKSGATYDSLNTRCGAAGCGAADRAEADTGKRDQTIANVGLAVGIAGAAAAVVFLLVRAYSPRAATSLTAGSF